MSAGTAPSPTEGEGQMMQEYAQYLPQVSAAQNAQVLPSSLAQLTAQQQVNQGYQDIASQNAASGAASNTALLNGAGGQSAQAALALNRETNPDYYSAQDAASKGAASAVNSINLTGLSPGENASVERSLNQNNVGTGNLGLLNPTNTISNAINFGGAFNNKLGLMNSAVNTATGAANSASGNAGVNAPSIALGTSQTNQGSNNTAGNSSLSSLSSNILSGLNSLTNTNLNNAAKVNFANSPQGIAGSFGAGNGLSGGSGCCFIFLQSYNGILPEHVRICRDYFYSLEPRIAKGYIRMAKYLVPIMKRSKLITSLVNKLMVTPITKYGGWLTNTPSYENCMKYSIYKKFWFKTWSILGGNIYA